MALYRLAKFCVVSSLHDGMNLVAKEFVAARSDERGVLVLSEMTGAAQELTDALIINPYDVDGFAAAIDSAIRMPADEQQRRMHAMRRIVAGHDVFLWASDILEGLERLTPAPRSIRGRAPRIDVLASVGRNMRHHQSTMPDIETALAEDVRRRADGKHLVVLLDFDGTLCEFEAGSAAVQLPAARPRGAPRTAAACDDRDRQRTAAGRCS